ncbi:MAG: hypothetical protein AAF413_04795, partial [Patescibacteria group bacterium]
DLSRAGNILSLSGDATDVDLSDLLDNTDSQMLSLAGNTLSLVDGGSVDLSPYLDDTTLTEAEVDAFVANNGYLTSEVDGSVTNEVNTGFTINGSNQLQLTDSNGTLSVNLAPYLDNTDALLALSCADGEVAKWNNTGTTWECATDIDTDTDTTLDEAAVDAFVANNGYLTTEVDGSTTNETNTTFELNGNDLELTDASGTLTVDLSSYVDTNTTYTAGNGISLVGTEFSINSPTCSGTDKLVWNGTAFTCSADIDTDTNLTEAEVDAFVSNNGYLTTEVDGVVGNEVLDATANGGLARSGSGTGGDPYTLGLRTDCTDGEVLSWDNTGSTWGCAAGLGDVLDGGNSTGATLVIGTNDPNSLEFETGGTSRVFIDTNGDVGVAGTNTNVESRLYAEDSVTTQYDAGISQLGPYTFDADNDADEAAWTFVSDNGGNGLNATGTNRAWSHATLDTPSVDIGPTSGQGGSPDGYIYTEMTNPGALGDTFHITNNTTIDASVSSWTVDFYWNQRGDDNTAIVEVQTNEAGAGWVTRGTYATGGPDVATAGAQVWNFESLDLSGVISNASTQIRFLVTAGAVGTSWHNDFGLDTITITPASGGGPVYGDNVFEAYNTNAVSDVDLLVLRSDVGSAGDVKFRVDSDGDVYADGTNFIGGGADLAENYISTDDAQPGDVVAFNSARSVEKTSEVGQTGLAGVVSTYAGIVLDSEVDGVPVALSGRAPTNVSVANGDIVRGDFLTSGPNGRAVKAISSGPVIGVAMEAVSEDGQIDVFVSLGYYSVPFSIDLDSIFNTGGIDVIEVADETVQLESEAPPDSSADKNEPQTEHDELLLTDSVQLISTQNQSSQSVEAELVRVFETIALNLGQIEERIAYLESVISDEQLSQEESSLDSDATSSAETQIDSMIFDVSDLADVLDLEPDSVAFVTEVRFNSLVKFAGIVEFAANASGSVRLAAGQTEVFVDFTPPYPGIPQVSLTPKEFIDGQWRLGTVETTGFWIRLSSAQDSELEFDWQAIYSTDEL